jgi:hypothetical protein
MAYREAQEVIRPPSAATQTESRHDSETYEKRRAFRRSRRRSNAAPTTPSSDRRRRCVRKRPAHVCPRRIRIGQLSPAPARVSGAAGVGERARGLLSEGNVAHRIGDKRVSSTRVRFHAVGQERRIHRADAG